MKFRIPLILGLIFFSLAAHASVRVALIEVRGRDGRLIQLEPNGRFAHVAVSYGKGWLHSYPMRGVEQISCAQLQATGKIAEIITLPEMPALDANAVDKYLGRAYDFEFSWTDDKIYCSELVAKLLNLTPEPMVFDPRLWPPSYQSRRGELGLSPDDIHRLLIAQGYAAEEPADPCGKAVDEPEAD